MKLGTAVRYQLPLVLWAASIFVLSGFQTLPITRTPIGFDKVAHFALFFVFCGLGWRAFFHQSASPVLRKWALLFGFLLAVIYGALDEVHQMFVPSRSPDVYDFVADGLGALAYVAWHRFRSRRVLEDGVDKEPGV